MALGREDTHSALLGREGRTCGQACGIHRSDVHAPGIGLRGFCVYPSHQSGCGLLCLLIEQETCISDVKKLHILAIITNLKYRLPEQPS